MATQVYLKRPSALAFQLDGLITLTSNGAFSGNAFLFQLGSDIEFFSSNGKGAINGQGWIERISSSSQNARLVRFMDSESISVHDIILVDSPTFHLIFQGVSNLDAYHITIRGPDIGGTDGIDLTCNDNCYIHDCEVTNRDECVSVKSPSANVLIEDMYCNHSGGMSIGSLSADSKFLNRLSELAADKSHSCCRRNWPRGQQHNHEKHLQLSMHANAHDKDLPRRKRSRRLC